MKHGYDEDCRRSGNIAAGSAFNGICNRVVVDSVGVCGCTGRGVLHRGFGASAGYVDGGFKACTSGAAGGAAHNDDILSLGSANNSDGLGLGSFKKKDRLPSHVHVADGVAYNGYPEPNIEAGLLSYSRVAAPYFANPAVQESTMIRHVNSSNKNNNENTLTTMHDECDTFEPMSMLRNDQSTFTTQSSNSHGR